MTDQQLEAHRHPDGRFGRRTRNRPSTSLAQREAVMAGRNYEVIENLKADLDSEFENVTFLTIRETEGFVVAGVSDADGVSVFTQQEGGKDYDETAVSHCAYLTERYLSALNDNRTWLDKAEPYDNGIYLLKL